MGAAPFQTVLHHLRRAACGSAEGVSDAELLRRFAAARDEAAFELLVRRHGSAVWRLCRRLVRDEQDAHDAFQAAFLALARSAAAVGQRGSVGGWLYRVAYRAALASRTRATRRNTRERPLGDMDLNDPAPTPHARAVAEELRQALAEEVARLPERYRLPLVLCGFAGLSNPEAARELGCPLGTLESRLARGRQRLRARLARRGFSVGAVAASLAAPHTSYAASVPALLAAAARAEGHAVSARVAALAGHALRIPLMTKLTMSSLVAVVCTGLVAWAALAVPGGGPAASLVPGKANAVRLPAAEVARLGLRVAEVPPPAPPQPRRLELVGTLAADPDRIVRVGSRFAGIVHEIGKTEGAGGRTLRVGDRVSRGQVLAVVWSKDLAEKKAALLDGLARLRLDRENLEKLTRAYELGALPEATLRNGQQAVQKSLNAVRAAERTLRLWKLDEADVESFRLEAELLIKDGGKVPAERVKAWGRVAIRAPLAGTLVERNVVVGDIVSPDGRSLFVVADLRTLQVTVRAPERELPALTALKPQARRWTIRVAADPDAEGIEGQIDRIAPTLDPADRTALLTGTVANEAGKLLPGQFVKVTVLLPQKARHLAIPAAALVEERGQAFVFVQPDPKQPVYQQRRVTVLRRGRDTAHIRFTPAT